MTYEARSRTGSHRAEDRPSAAELRVRREES